MMIGSSTSCRKVCAIHATITMVLPVAMAAGRETSAISVKRYAVHIVPTDRVINTARELLKLPIAPAPWTLGRIVRVVISLGLCTVGSASALA